MFTPVLLIAAGAPNPSPSLPSRHRTAKHHGQDAIGWPAERVYVADTPVDCENLQRVLASRGSVALLSDNRGGGLPLAGTFAILFIAIPVAIYLVFFGFSLPEGANGSASPGSAPAERSSPTSAAAEAAAATEGLSPGTDASPAREYGIGEVISLPSRPGASVVVTNVEWRDRIARQTEAGEISYVDPDLGRFLVVTYELTNAGDTPLDPDGVVAPTLEGAPGDVYRPIPMSGTLDVNGEPLLVPEGEVVAPGAAVTLVRLFDVRNQFAGGYLSSAPDDYRLPVGPAQ